MFFFFVIILYSVSKERTVDGQVCKKDRLIFLLTLGGSHPHVANRPERGDGCGQPTTSLFTVFFIQPRIKGHFWRDGGNMATSLGYKLELLPIGFCISV